MRSIGRLGTLKAGLLALSFISAAASVHAQAPATTPEAASAEDATELAKKLQNPIGDLYSFPFQNNTNFNSGPNKGTQDILNVQPVIPIHINSDWNVITRTILPLIWQPSFQPAQTVPFGTGPTTFSAFLSPSQADQRLAMGRRSRHPDPDDQQRDPGLQRLGRRTTGVLVYMKGPWVTGALANNVWSFGGTSGLGGTRYNAFLTQPFVNYNFGEGWYVTTAPIITANWRRPATRPGHCRSARRGPRHQARRQAAGQLVGSAPTTTRCGRSSGRSGSCGHRPH